MNGQVGRLTELCGDPLGTDNGILLIRMQLVNIDRPAGGSGFKLPRKVYLSLSLYKRWKQYLIYTAVILQRRGNDVSQDLATWINTTFHLTLPC